MIHRIMRWGALLTGTAFVGAVGGCEDVNAIIEQLLGLIPGGGA